VTDHDSLDPSTAPPAWRRWIENPIYMLVLAALALVVGIVLSRNTTRSAAERAALPPRADCVRFPGACADGVPTAPPAELAALHTEVAAADSAWRTTLARESRSGVFPDKGLTAMRDALVATESAVRDARALLQEAEQQQNADARALALDALREAYESKRALLTRATRLLEEAI